MQLRRRKLPSRFLVWYKCTSHIVGIIRTRGVRIARQRVIVWKFWGTKVVLSRLVRRIHGQVRVRAPRIVALATVAAAIPLASKQERRLDVMIMDKLVAAGCVASPATDLTQGRSSSAHLGGCRGSVATICACCHGKTS